ncbi:ROK family protein [Actinoplanes sp. NPDC051851]|uniref:ROK family protein n=1 Tax=Actinoplanes sp. NPDC051851 TaxID=3154753 RepID=UPI003439DC1D
MSTDSRAHLVSSDVRDHNLGLVLTTVDRLGGAARAEIALETGLARSAMSNLSAVLLESRLLRPAEEQPVARIGRRIERLELDGRHLAVVGAQLEVDEALVLAHDLGGRVLYREALQVRTAHGDAEAIATLIAERVTACLADLTARSITPISLDLVVPGMVTDGETVKYALDLGWIGVPFRELVASRVPAFPAGVHLGGDAPLAGYAEFTALREEPGLAGLTNMYYLKSATGIGGAVIMDGRLLTGSHGTLYAPGHVIVVPDGLLCACGRNGCLATVADPEVVLRNAGLSDFRDRKGLPAALEELIRRARAGEEVASAAVTEAMRWFRMLLDNTIFLYEPELIVLGGYLASFVDELSRLPQPTLEWLGCGNLRGPLAIQPARRGAFAAVHGAITLRRLELLAAPTRCGLLAVV